MTNKDEIIAMAQAAGMNLNLPAQDAAVPAWHMTSTAGLERFAALVAAKERERIAAWIEPQRNGVPATGAEFANAIRARGEQA